MSVQLPSRFEGMPEEQETGVQRRADEPMFQKSIYGMFAQAGSSAKLQDGGQSEDDEDDELEDRVEQVKGRSGKEAAHRKKLSDTNMMRSLLKPIRERGATSQLEEQAVDPMSQSQILPERERPESLSERPASTELKLHNETPALERKLEAQARAEMGVAASAIHKSTGESEAEADTKRLPQALADIFAFEELEEVLAQWPCWLLQSVLLQGHMYITTKHICFYAYLRKKGTMLKSGYMNKQGKRSSRYKRHWFTLKGDMLSYYPSQAQPYNLDGSIDLRFAITAELAPGSGREGKDFTITTESRIYHFRADSAPSAKEWVKQLQKVIFRTRNDGDSVKICLPIKNVADIEANPVIDGSDTIKMCVVDNAEDFAVDEYFFAFFSRGNDALSMLNTLTADNEARKAYWEEDVDLPTLTKVRTPEARRSLSVEKRSPRLSPLPGLAKDTVRSTLSPPPMSSPSSPRTSGELRRASVEASRTSSDRGRSSFEAPRRSLSGKRRSTSRQAPVSSLPFSPSAHDSVDFFATGKSGPLGGVDAMSASQMLKGDSAFRAPTLRKAQQTQMSSQTTTESSCRSSRGTSRASSQAPDDRIRVQPPSRTPTEQALGERKTWFGRRSIDTAKQGDSSKLQGSEATIAPRSSRPIAAPLQTAVSYVRDSSKRVSSYLSSSPGEYYGKLAGAWAGQTRHYTESEGLAPEDSIDDPEDLSKITEDEQRFRKHFTLDSNERIVATFFVCLHRVLPLYGKIYIGTNFFCYRSLNLKMLNTKIVIPLKEIDNVEKEKGYRINIPGLRPGMVLVIRGHEELFFDFASKDIRDDCVVTVLRALDRTAEMEGSKVIDIDEVEESRAAAAENELLQQARAAGQPSHELPPSGLDDDDPPILFDDGTASLVDFTPKKPMRITCLTIGSRGDVQPYIALCKGLLEQGHKPKIATHAEFGAWVRKHGIEFAPVEGNPAELMQLCVEHGMFTPKFISETNSKFRGWLDNLLQSAWDACQGSDLLIESPSAMAGVHIAEALGIPYFRAFTMPWTKTRAYPHAFGAQNHKWGGTYNISTYNLFEQLFWQMTASQMNRWRKQTLGLRQTGLSKLQQNKIPFLYNFSPNVVVPPLDFSDWIRVTGYWFLDEADKWSPPDDLLAFIKKAREDNMKLVYIGFGSVVVSDSKVMTQNIVDAVIKADVRCILSKGWSDRLDATEPGKAEIALPPSIFQISSAPHDWLFKQIDAAVHHGGAGTTGASLRAGIPTIIKPFFGDQFFFATRVEDIGVGLRIKHVTQNALGKALWIATHDDRMRNKARALGERIRAENGVQTAIKAIYRDMEYARTLIQQKAEKSAPVSSGMAGPEEKDDDAEEDTEESWTFVESESEADLVGHGGVRISDPLGWDRHSRQRRLLGGLGRAGT